MQIQEVYLCIFNKKSCILKSIFLQRGGIIIQVSRTFDLNQSFLRHIPSKHILVIVAAMMLGAQGSVPVVCVFAVTSMWIGTYSLSQLDRIFSPFASGMPFGSIMLAFARVLFAAGAGWLFDLYFRKPRRYVYLGIAGIAAASTFLHGLCVFAVLYCGFPMLRQMILENLFSYPIFRDWLSYVLAIISCCGIHWVLTRKLVKNRLSQLCDCPPAMQESGNRKRLIYSEAAAVVVGILCILFLRKAIFKELYLQGIDVSESLHQNITAFLLQALVALVGTLWCCQRPDPVDLRVLYGAADSDG